MTYWPISSPSVFAATKETSSERTCVSHDGVHHGAGSSAAASEGEPEGGVPETTGATEEVDARKQLSEEEMQHEEAAEHDITGEILAIKVTRTGHMFATITRTTLTIWQTKVRL